ncbi:MAG: MFS transporter [Gemmatimonadetes bacterium]|nr:MFS transporter [Gemmatimonadota bacterium]
MSVRTSLNPFRVLAHSPNFRLFFAGQTTSLVGTWMQQVAQGWLALQLSNDAFLVGVVAAAGTVPILLLSLPGGIVADRVRRLRVVGIAQALLAAEAALLWWFVWSGHITIGWLIAIALLGGAIAAFEIPARQALFIELVGKEHVMDAIALNSSGFNFARIVGPSLAAIVIARYGIAWCFGLNALSYLAVLISLSMIRLPHAAAAAPARALHALGEAFTYVRTHRLTAVLMQVVAVYSLLSIPVLTLLPVLARDVLGLDAGGYGVLMTCVGVGAMIGALSIAAVGPRLRRHRALVVTSLAFPVLLLAVALSRTELLTGAVLFAVGACMVVNSAVVNALLQSATPDALRGRVISIYVAVYIGTNPIGSFISGWIARHWGTPMAIGGMAVVMGIYAAWALRRYPELRGAA